MRTSQLVQRLSVTSLASDLRFAVRAMARRRAFTATIVVTLALGIGANTAVFSLVDAVILHPLPLRDVDRLVAIYEPTRDSPFGLASLRTHGSLAARSTVLADVAAQSGSTLKLTEGDTPQDVNVGFVTPSYFSVVGVRARIGRVLTASDAADPAASEVIVLSDAFWQSRFGGDSAIVGKRIRVGQRPLTVVGVAEAGFRGTTLVAATDAWVPVAVAVGNVPLLSRGGALNEGVPMFTLIGRLAPGASHERASSEIGGIVQGATVVPLTQAASGVRQRAELMRFVRLLLAVVVLTLVLACVNVANLLVVRGVERARELGVRTAIGASAGRIAQHLLAEALVLAGAGGVAGLAVGMGTLRVLSAYTLPGGVALEKLSLGLDMRVLAFTTIVSVVTAAAFGLLPAVYATRANVVDALRGREGTIVARRGRSVLLAVQVAISLVLIVGAGLFIRSVQAGLETGIGFDPRPLAAVTVQTKFDGRHADNIVPLLAIVEQSKQTPGVTSAAVSSHVPLMGTWKLSFTSSAAPRDTVRSAIASVSSDFFATLGIPLVEGRAFDARDRADAPRVVIINETAARTFFRGDSPLGQTLDRYGQQLTVVGVVRDVKYTTLADDRVPFIFAPFAQEDFPGSVTFVVRSTDPQRALAELRRTVSVLAPDLKVLATPTMRPRLVSDQILAVLAPQRFGATLMSVFALIALCVSAVGIHGAVAHVVARRTTEIGVRVALGAQRRDVLRLVLGESGVAVAAGVGLGVGGAFLASRLLAHLLYEVSTTDLVAFSGAVVVVAATAMVASLVPALRAVRIDPANAMRVL